MEKEDATQESEVTDFFSLKNQFLFGAAEGIKCLSSAANDAPRALFEPLEESTQ